MSKSKRSKNRLVDVGELIKYVLYTDYVALDIHRKQVPVSALVIAKSESGKTALVDQYYPNNGILYANDITAWGIQHRWLPEMQEGKIRRIMIPDLVNPVNRQQTTVDSLITFLNSYISWEGVSCIMTYAMQIELETPVRGSIITTVTPEDFERVAQNLSAVGFLSRLMPIHYGYSDEAIDEILSGIAREREDWKQVNLSLPNETQVVSLNSDLGDALAPMAKKIGEHAGAYGFRALHALRALCCAKALSEGRTEVNTGDVVRLIELTARFVKFPREGDTEYL